MTAAIHDLVGRTARTVTHCRTCGGARLVPYLDLGHMPPADQFLRLDQIRRPVVHFPLTVVFCTECGLSQLSCVVAPEILYQDDYPYESSTTRAGREHFRAFAAGVAGRFGLGKDDLVVDVGSNVGVLLQGFAEEGARVLGVDPAENIAAIARASGIPTIPTFFGPGLCEEIRAEHGPAAVITASNVFAHVDDLDAFMTAVDALLEPGGVFVFEAPHFANLLARMEYDTIYHEHLSYLSLRPLVPFLARLGMRMFDVEEVDLHGGSCRVFIDRGEHEVDEESLGRLLERERAEGVHDLVRLHAFAVEVAEHRTQLRELLFGLKAEGKRIAGVSAPAKGSTLLNYCGIGRETLDYVTEKAALKIGRYTPGGDISVVADEELLADGPDYALLLAWNFAAEIMGNLAAYQEAGGRFIIPMPHPTVVPAGEAAMLSGALGAAR